jgi:pimeloyl-ACP methyl ester carboxylesterase
MRNAGLRFPVLTLLMASLLAMAFPTEAAAQLLKPYKDALFAYPRVLAKADGDRHFTVDYREQRDINGRDEVPERRAKSRYIELSVRRAQQDLMTRTEVARIPHMTVGKSQGARFIVVYVHGQGGSREQGMNDFTFGGNFNRIKNLAARNGGLYVTTDFSDFGKTGARQVASLIALYSARSPGAPVFVACGSMGGAICWRLADSPLVAGSLGGLLLLGSHWDEAFLSSRAFSQRVPVYFGHGSGDSVFPIAQQERFFRSILAKAPDYPARFLRFETGSHGTPIRMVDWRNTLNWMHASD